MKFTTDQLFFSSMLKELEYKPTNNELSLLNELSDEMANMAISYYPSSGADINDLFYANNKKVERLGELNPSIFIHSDFIHTDLNSPDNFDKDLRLHRINILGSVKVFDKSKLKSIYIYKLKTPISDEFKWLVLFWGYYNEEVLIDLINSKINVPLIYAVCDGITMGSGASYTPSIPTIMYPFLAVDLEIKYIITEQNSEYIKSFIEQKYDQFRTWLNNVLLVSKNPSIKNLLELSNKELEKELTIRLLKIEQQFLNTNGRLRCIGGYQFTDMMVIKKIN